MRKYTDDIRVPRKEAKKLIKLPSWEFVGESTSGAVYWNNETGEVLSEATSADFSGDFDIKRLIVPKTLPIPRGEEANFDY